MKDSAAYNWLTRREVKQMTLKQKVVEHCVGLLNNKIRELQKTMDELKEGIKNDSKSSAGDKHETARAMAQIEQEKTAKLLNEALEQKAALEKINISSSSPIIIKGSLVKTNTVYLFIGVAIGRITIENTAITVISPQSPLGAKLMGRKPNDTAQVNGVNYLIEHIE